MPCSLYYRDPAASHSSFGGTVSSWEEVLKSQEFAYLYEVCANLMLRKENSRDWVALSAVKEHFTVTEQCNFPEGGAFKLVHQDGLINILTVAKGNRGLVKGLQQLLFMTALLSAVPSEAVLRHLDGTCPGCGQRGIGQEMGLEPENHYVLFKVPSPTQNIEMRCCIVFDAGVFSLWKVDPATPLWDLLS